MNVPIQLSNEQIEQDITHALSEDIGSGDVTTAALPDKKEHAHLLCKQDAVICGRPWFDRCHTKLNPQVRIHWHVNEGDHVHAKTILATLHGSSHALLKAERSALNFLQTLSGTATVTATYVAAIAHTRVRLLDTRKTIPGLRCAQKYAVRIGGGYNHRFGLYDAILLKENHIHIAGSVSNAIMATRAAQPNLPLIVEVTNITQLQEALQTGCDRILIDNFDTPTRHKAVHIAAEPPFNHTIPLEVSGGINLAELCQLAEDGVDYISIGALTKNLHSIDLSMKIIPKEILNSNE